MKVKNSEKQKIIHKLKKLLSEEEEILNLFKGNISCLNLMWTASDRL